MKLIRLFICFLFTLSVHAQDSITCQLEATLNEYESLAADGQAIYDWSLNEIAKKFILRQCVQAGADNGVKLRGNRLVFTDLSYTFNTQVPFYFCKNKKGYENYLLSVKEQIQKVLTQKERQAYKEFRKGQKPEPAPMIQAAEPPPKRWRCAVQGYLKHEVIVTDAQKFGIEQTYGKVCSPL